MSAVVSDKDLGIIRDLAKKQLEYAHSERNQNNIRDWYALNACRPNRPMIHLENWTFGHEIAPKLSCEGEAARGVEAGLRGNMLNTELFGDDKPVTDTLTAQYNVRRKPFGLDIGTTGVENSLAYQYDHPIGDLQEDFHKLGYNTLSIDKKAVEQHLDFVGSLIGDILTPGMTGRYVSAHPTQEIVKVMGMETMFMSMKDYPELFHKMMDMYLEDTLRYHRYLEDNELLLPTVGAQYLLMGSWCFNEELPSEIPPGGKLYTKDIWGYLESQETVGLSPAMFGEFIFPTFKRLAEEYGLLCYGCCEPVHPFWDDYIGKLNGLRKVSISPWCDEQFMGERLRGKKIVYQRKPDANFLSFGPLDEDAWRKYIRKTIKAARGCPLEITQRDVYTIDNDVAKCKRYVAIIREEIEDHWQG
ncbi:MAG: hypothetical protein FWE69_08690 [Clostridiales bacterium]|nr:hypothetical protein [Clostridiales bacterium]